MQVPELAFSKMASARKAMGELVNIDLMQSWQDIATTVMKAKDTLISLDRSIKIDLAVLGPDAAPTLIKAMKKKVVDIMPNLTKRVSLEIALTQVQALKTSTQYKCSPMAAQTCVNVVCDIIANMMSAIAPDPTQVCSGDTFFKTIFLQLAFFCNATDADKELSGRAAAQFMFKELVVANQTTPSTLGDLNLIQTYRWLLDDEQQASLKDWVIKAVVGDGQTKGARRMAADHDAQRNVRARSKAKAKAKANVSSTADVMRFFS